MSRGIRSHERSRRNGHDSMGTRDVVLMMRTCISVKKEIKFSDINGPDIDETLDSPTWHRCCWGIRVAGRLGQPSTPLSRSFRSQADLPAAAADRRWSPTAPCSCRHGDLSSSPWQRAPAAEAISTAASCPIVLQVRCSDACETRKLLSTNRSTYIAVLTHVIHRIRCSDHRADANSSHTSIDNRLMSNVIELLFLIRLVRAFMHLLNFIQILF